MLRSLDDQYSKFEVKCRQSLDNWQNPWFQCENQVEELEDTILEMFAEEGENRDIELCSKR